MINRRYGIEMINDIDYKGISVENPAVILPYEITAEFYIEQLGEIEKKPYYDFFKRVFDIFASLIALIILFVPMLILAINIKCVSRGRCFIHKTDLD